MSKKGYKVSVIFGNGYNHFLSNYFLNEKEAILEKLKARYLKKVVNGEKLTAKKLTEQYETITNMLQAYKHMLVFSDEEDAGSKNEALLLQIIDLYNADEQTFLEDFLTLIQKTTTEVIGGEIGGTYNIATTMIRESFLPLAINRKNVEQPTDFFTALTKEIPNRRFAFDIYTTNFDGFVQKLFESDQKNITINALHGAYNEASIIYHAPMAKFSAIKKNIELSRRFVYFGQNIPQSDVIVLFGCSLKTDPHLIAILNRAQPERLIIIDKEPQRILSNFVDEVFVRRTNEIFFICTEKNVADTTQQDIYNTPEKLLERLVSILK